MRQAFGRCKGAIETQLVGENGGVGGGGAGGVRLLRLHGNRFSWGGWKPAAGYDIIGLAAICFHGDEIVEKVPSLIYTTTRYTAP